MGIRSLKDFTIGKPKGSGASGGTNPAMLGTIQTGYRDYRLLDDGGIIEYTIEDMGQNPRFTKRVYNSNGVLMETLPINLLTNRIINQLGDLSYLFIKKNHFYAMQSDAGVISIHKYTLNGVFVKKFPFSTNYSYLDILEESDLSLIEESLFVKIYNSNGVYISGYNNAATRQTIPIAKFISPTVIIGNVGTYSFILYFNGSYWSTKLIGTSSTNPQTSTINLLSQYAWRDK
ncbi:hypothetical protein ACFSO7_02970 [Bacillus sp. CGMCC 1.16607]|uniref:hypothetical protein n=1 Tax=Bacillus sp. CGMCC 1.16607 TaxID=3351842 RepID=UPI003632DEDB